MTPKQQEQFNMMLDTLKRISNQYETTKQLRKESGLKYGLDYEEALEMAYENIQAEAAICIQGIKQIK